MKKSLGLSAGAGAPQLATGRVALHIIMSPRCMRLPAAARKANANSRIFHQLNPAKVTGTMDETPTSTKPASPKARSST
jgi:hypothetical protein